MSKSSKENSSDDKLKQTKMGDFLSKDSKKTGEKKRKVKSPSTSMWSSFWTRGAYRDTEEYRNGYPGKKDNENWDDNYEFYMNHIPSKPDGDFIDNIHANWYGDYKRLEIHHGYIQWLFPIRDTGMNWHAQELQLHEIEKLTKNRTAKKRILKSYKMMLDFYGMILKNESTGEIERAENWKERFKHLNRSYHNYLRITRILKSLGEFDFENLKANFVRFILYEGIVEYTLDNLIDSCVKYWIGVLRSDEEREAVLDLYEELQEKHMSEKGDSKKRPKSASPEPIIKVKTGPSKYVNKFASDSDSDLEADMAQYNDMDLLADTLPFENATDEEAENETDNKDTASSTKKKGNLRIVHSMSDSDNEEFKTPDVDESQETTYWNSSNKTVDGAAIDGTQKIEASFESNMGEEETVDGAAIDGTQKIEASVESNMGEEDNTDENGMDRKKANLIGAGDEESEKKHVTIKKENNVDKDICSDQVDGAITSKDARSSKIESDKSVKKNTNEVPSHEIKETVIDEVTDKEKENTNRKSSTDENNGSIEETPMETGDDGNVMV